MPKSNQSRNPLIEASNLSAWYETHVMVLDGVCLKIAEKEIVGLIGLNGAGKTTLVNVLSGILQSSSADSIKYRGKAICFQDNSFKKQRYTVFAEDDSFGYCSFKEYLLYVSSAYDASKEVVTNNAKEISSLLNFDTYLNQAIKDLSTGNRKKAFLIAGLSLRPPLLILDEPFNGLDFESTEQLYRLLKDYRQYGSVLFASHILESITTLSDKILVLSGGKIAETFEGDFTGETIRGALAHDFGL